PLPKCGRCAPAAAALAARPDGRRARGAAPSIAGRAVVAERGEGPLRREARKGPAEPRLTCLRLRRGPLRPSERQQELCDETEEVSRAVHAFRIAGGATLPTTGYRRDGVRSTAHPRPMSSPETAGLRVQVTGPKGQSR